MNLSKKALESILPKEESRQVKRIRFLSKKTKTTTYIVKTYSNCYVLSLFNRKDDSFDSTNLMEINNSLNDLGFPLPKIISSGYVENQKALLTAHHNGKVINYLTPEHYAKIGYLLGNLHQITQSITDPMPSIPLVIGLRNKFEKLLPRLPKEFLPLESILQSLEKSWPLHLPTGIIHGDIWYKNILFQDEEISAILNFTNPICDLLILDLAGLIKGFYGSESCDESYEAFISSYQRARPMSIEEIAGIEVALKAKFFSTVLQNLEKPDFDPASKDEYYAVAYMNFLKLQQIHEKHYIGINK